MNASRAWLLVAAVLALLPQINAQSPLQALQGAADQFFAAQNYSWEQKLGIGIDAKTAVPRATAEGETEIDGFTVMTSSRRTMVLRGAETVLKLKDDWRYANDLTDDDLQEVFRVLPAERTRDRIRRTYTHALPHEILRLVLPALKNIRDDAGTVVADVDPTAVLPIHLQAYVNTGHMPTDPSARTVFGLPTSTRTRPDSRILNLVKATFTASITNGLLDEFSLEFASSPTVSLGGGPKEQHDFNEMHVIKLLRVGSTRVNVDPVAKALFIDAPSKR